MRLSFLRVLEVAAVVAQPLNRLVTIGIHNRPIRKPVMAIFGRAGTAYRSMAVLSCVAQFVEKPSRHR
jgi:hypothetical protein